MQYRIKVHTKQRKERVIELSDGRLEIFVDADRKNGDANRRVCILLADFFSVDVSCITIIKGKSAPFKEIIVNKG